MNHLWAPWRMQYVTNADGQSGCVFCTCIEQESDDATGVLVRAQHNFIILNAFPYNNGHLMVIPYRHTAELGALPPETDRKSVV